MAPGSSLQLDLFRPTKLIFPDSKFEQRNEYKKTEQSERNLTVIPMAAIHPGQLNIYNEIHWEPSKPQKYSTDGSEKQTGPTYNHLLKSSRSAEGKVSTIAKRKMLKALNYFLLLTNEKTVYQHYSGRQFKFKLAFVTLTLPSSQFFCKKEIESIMNYAYDDFEQCLYSEQEIIDMQFRHSDNTIKQKLLNSFLIELKKYYHVKHYIWRAEKQANGNLHFHILVDKFIPYQELRDRWNRITNKLGYVDRYRESQQSWHRNGFRVRENLLKTWPKEKQLAAYKRGAKTHWNSPNSTDIHSVQKVHNIKLYISKYITKSPELDEETGEIKELNIKQTGRIWGCDYMLSNIKGAQTVLDGSLKDEIDIIANDPDSKVISDTYFTIIFFDFALIQKHGCEQLYKLFMSYLLEKFGHSTQLTLAA